MELASLAADLAPRADTRWESATPQATLCDMPARRDSSPRYVLLAVLLASPALLFAPRTRAAPTTSPAPESAPADEIRKEGATYLDESFDAYEGLRKLQALAAAADWSAATDAARSLVERHGTRVCRESARRFISIRTRVARLIAAWPSDGLAVYVRRNEPAARTLLEDARARGDINALLQIAENDFPTPAAADAVELACAIALEAGNFDFAVQWLTELIDRHPLRSERGDTWRTFRAVAAAWAGDTAPIAELSAAPRPATPATWAGHEVDLARVLAAAPQSSDAARAGSPDPNNTFYVSSRRDNVRDANALAEAVIWRFDRFGPNTLSETTSGENPVADAPAPQARALAGGRLLAMQPVAAAGRVIVHDHRSVWAIDPAHTDRPAWRFDLVETADAGQPWTSDDEPPPLFTTTIADGRVYAPLERKPPDRYGADPANPGASVLVCLDIDTGRPIWSADLASWRSEFEEARMDSAPIVVRDRVLAVVRRRKAFGFEACYLIGFNVEDGRIAFATHLGESAIGGYGYRRATLTHAAACGDRVFVQTNLGTLAAVSAATGALHWLFQYATPSSDTAAPPGPGRYNQQTHAWQNSPPMIWRDRIVAAPLDADELFVLNQNTGDPAPGITLDELRKPDTLVGIHDSRIFLAGSYLVAYDLAARRLAWERQLPDGELHGAPAMSSDAVFIPTTTALLSFPLDGGPPRPFPWDLSNAGNVTVVPARFLTAATGPVATTRPADWPDQLIVAAPGAIYALARKEDAFARMEATMAARPSDPSAALALADLCLRTREFERGIAALDAALERAGGLARIADPDLRRRLFDACMGFADAIAAAAHDPHASSRPSAADLAIPLLRRAGQISLEPPDQVAFRVRLARVLESENQPEAAVATWQQILSDPSLRQISISTRLLEGRADAPDELLETPLADELARSSIDHLIAEHGAKVYAATEADADQRLAAAHQAGDAVALLRIADAFPNGTAAPRALLHRADLLEKQGRLDEAAGSLRRALACGIAINRPAAMLQLARLARSAGRPAEAAAWIDRVERDSPQYESEIDGRKLRLPEMRAALLKDWRDRPHRPTPGDRLARAYAREFSEVPLVLTPRYADLPETAFDAAYIYVNDAIDCRTARDDAPRWPHPCPCRMTPAFLGMDARHVIFSTRHQVLAIDRATGELSWKLGEYPADADAPGVDPESIAAWSHHALTPQRIYSAGDRGELVAANLSDGAVQWRVPTTQRVAAELVADDEVVAYVARQVRSSLVVIRRAADGRELAEIHLPDERAVQSLALAPPGLLLVLCSRELFAYRTADAQSLWHAPLKSRAVPASLRCDSGSACILGDDGRLFAIDLADGRLAWISEPLPSPPATTPWTDVAGGLLVAAARHVLTVLDVADGRRIWSAADAELPIDPSAVQSPQLLDEAVMLVTANRDAGPDAEPPVRRSRRNRKRDDERYRANIYPLPAGRRSEPPPPVRIDLGRLNQFRGAFAFDHAILVVDGHQLIGYAPPDRPPPATQP